MISLMTQLLFPFSLFLSAFLLFSLQPLVAKSLLPFFGGASSVWTINSIFFSGLLLLGYCYAACLSHLNKALHWRSIHISIMVLSFISIPVIFKMHLYSLSPEWAIIKNLTLQLALPTLVLSATAPLLQFVYNQTQQKNAKDPYFLYAASNTGSLMALICYPFMIERFLKLQNQYTYWSIGYVILMVLLAIIFFSYSFTDSEKKPQSVIESNLNFKWFYPFYWILMSFIPCSLMFATITYISMDIAAIPLFWVIPLSLYLITFILVFREKKLISYQWLSKNAPYLMILPILSMVLPIKSFPYWITLVAHLLNFFVFSLICHQTLYEHRPEPSKLTSFYLSMSLGGFLAGIFNGVIAPNYFNYNYEYFISMILALFALPKIIKKSYWLIFYIVMVVLLLAKNFNQLNSSNFIFISILLLTFILQKKRLNLMMSLILLSIFGLKEYLFTSDEMMSIQRNFYGIKKIINKNNLHILTNQSTVHGFQNILDENPNGENSYYGVVAPLIKIMKAQLHPMTTTLIGLGAGSMVCQFNPDTVLHLVEIDQQVIDIAKDQRLFTYLKKCPGQWDIQKQDGRLFVQALPDHSQDLIVIDAFSSDAIPVHLLTQEAFKIYQQKITPNGGMLIHISNRHLNIGPVIYANAISLNQALFMLSTNDDLQNAQYGANWIFLTQNLEWVKNLKNWRFNPMTYAITWTDDYSNIVSILR
jgi:spermidine synthase